jgi:hypothetical protein
MRPVKLFLGLLLAAAVLITFLKILLFIVMAGLFMATIFLAGRAIWWMGGRGRRHQRAFARPGQGRWQSFDQIPGSQQGWAEPIVPRYQKPFEPSPFARTIEVL